MEGLEYYKNQAQLVKDIVTKTQERVYILTHYGAESPNPLICCNFNPYIQMPNLAWFVETFKQYSFEIENVLRYRTQYLNHEMMFLSAYNSKMIDSTPINIEKEWKWCE